MCGFTFQYSFNKIDKEHITSIMEKCNQEMQYRGPDEENIFVNENVAFSHVRLSIIGINDGNQPMFDATNDIILVCNGEIYNHEIIKKDLEKKGHVFKTKSDSETIIHLYKEYGNELFKHLDGMYSFVLFDKVKNLFIAGRDPFGQKPLYYSINHERIVFSSELKVINKFFLKNKSLNYDIINQVQSYSYSIDESQTFINQIKKIPSGNYATFNTTNGFSIQKHFHRIIKSNFNGNYKTACEISKNLIQKAVLKRHISEVPVAILLSAGFDSSTIALLSKQLGNNINVICAGYKGCKETDERSEAKKFAKDLGFTWIEIELDTNDFIEYHREIINYLDEPCCDPAIYANWGIFKKAKELGFKVLINGNGADELFYGYKSHNITSNYFKLSFDLKNRFLYKSLRNKLKTYANLFFKRQIIEMSKAFNLKLHHPINEVVEKSSKYNFLKLEHFYNDSLNYPIDRYYNILNKTWLPNNCYHISDKLGMAHSIEVRSPFADKDLVNFIDSLPIEMKFDSKTPKKFLKDSLKDDMPYYVSNRPKTGFTPPFSYIYNLVDKHKNVFFKERLVNLPQIITDEMIFKNL